MIEISKLTKGDVGKWVKYTDFSKTEIGKIKSWNNKFIFVVYSCNYDWNNFRNYTAAATSPEDLLFCEAPKSTRSEILYEGRDYDSSVKEANAEIGDGLPVEGGLRGFVNYLNTVGDY